MEVKHPWFYKILWIIFMLIIDVYDIIVRGLNIIYFYYMYFRKTLDKCSSLREFQYLNQYKSNLKRIPKHISVVVRQNDVCPKVLSNIAVYALISDIDYISFYDPGNTINLDKIRPPKYVSNCKLQNGRYLWSIPVDKKGNGLYKYKNGLEKAIEIRYLSYREGKPLIAEVCKELCADKESDQVQKALEDRKVLTGLIEERLNKKLGDLPRPDFVIILDDVLCTYGLLPWHTGFSEFYTLETQKFISAKSFANILCKYAHCEQRFGK